GDDQEGEDWLYDEQGNTEIRYYQGGTFRVSLGKSPLVVGEMPKTRMILIYGTPGECWEGDDEIIVETEGPAFPENATGNASQTYKNLAQAFLADTGETGFHISMYVPPNSNMKEPFQSRDRFGLVMSLAEAQLVSDSPCP
ncbi:MAG: hypothetical protein VX938_09210, partial [Myxococcota bacterium]|nr:hypothetical protein [Myxococcota bacterium]